MALNADINLNLRDPVPIAPEKWHYILHSGHVRDPALIALSKMALHSCTIGILNVRDPHSLH